MKSLLKEFKKFALKGSVVDLAVGIIIGASFNQIVNSLVSDIVMPPIGLILSKVNFSDLYINLGSAEYESLALAKAAGAPTINYGTFISVVISFVITAFVIFLIVKSINKIKERGEKPVEPNTKECQFCISSVNIRASKCPFCSSDL